MWGSRTESGSPSRVGQGRVSTVQCSPAPGRFLLPRALLPPREKRVRITLGGSYAKPLFSAIYCKYSKVNYGRRKGGIPKFQCHRPRH